MAYDDSVYCWGSTEQLDGVPNGYTPAHRVEWLHDATQISVGTNSLCAIRRDHSVWCYGYLEENGLNQQVISGYGQLPIPGARP